MTRIDSFMPDVLKIAILDDHRMFLEGISLVMEGMESRFSIDGFDSPSSLLEKIKAQKSYDLIICDLVMNQMNGLAFVAATRGHDKSTPILILSGINSEPPIKEMIRLGANGFVHKSAENDELLKAINILVDGGKYFEGYTLETGSLDFASETENQSRDLPTTIPILGKRQIEVLQMIAKGASNKEISSTLSISENTVKTHLRQIFEELGVNKRTACVSKAQALGII